MRSNLQVGSPRPSIDHLEAEHERISSDMLNDFKSLVEQTRKHLSIIKIEMNHLSELNLLASSEESFDAARYEMNESARQQTPQVLMDHGLFVALENYLIGARKKSETVISFTYDVDREKMTFKHEVLLFRIIESLIENTLSHAHASEIKVMLKKDTDGVVLDYKTDGQPTSEKFFTDLQNPEMKTIKNRVRYLNGDITLKNLQGHGIRISMHIPIPG